MVDGYRSSALSCFTLILDHFLPLSPVLLPSFCPFCHVAVSTTAQSDLVSLLSCFGQVEKIKMFSGQVLVLKQEMNQSSWVSLSCPPHNLRPSLGARTSTVSLDSVFCFLGCRSFARCLVVAAFFVAYVKSQRYSNDVQESRL